MNLDNPIFKKPITEVIKARTSMRSYNGVPLDKTIGDSIIDAIIASYFRVFPHELFFFLR